MSEGKLEKETARLIEDFLANLSRTLSRAEEPKYSMKEMEKQLKGLESILGVLSQRWSLAIIFLLYLRSLNFSELRELLPGISSRTLTDKLRMLEGSGFLSRNVMTSGPVRVRYSLTTRGREIALSCLPLLYQMRKQRIDRIGS